MLEAGSRKLLVINIYVQITVEHLRYKILILIKLWLPLTIKRKYYFEKALLPLTE